MITNTVHFQPGCAIDQPEVFHSLGSTEREVVREAIYEVLKPVAKALGAKVMDQLFSHEQLAAKLVTHLPSGWTIETHADFQTQEHVYRNGQWICDSTYPLFKNQNQVIWDDVTSEGLIEAYGFVTVSSPHNWLGQ